ncbi:MULTISPECIES: hypothetical protein [Gracilibacillus]|uniref:hypothetical protein n=1 Tax=Gracilibacillus TaxID=74385 RepID=UPI000A719D06|nr:MULTISPECIES: hypothetical protein [Gracilibacillus]
MVIAPDKWISDSLELAINNDTDMYTSTDMLLEELADTIKNWKDERISKIQSNQRYK